MSTTKRLLSNASIISITPPDAPSFDPKGVNDVALEAARKFLTDKVDFRRVANFAGITETGEVNDRTGGACHYSIRHMDKTYRYCVATENGALRSGKSLELVAPFLEWFLYHSQYSPFILNRDDFDFCLNHGFIVSGTMPRKLLQNIMIITRHFFEVTARTFKEFNTAVLEKGIDPLVAYSVLFNSNLSYGTDTPYLETPEDASFYQGYPGHRVQRAYLPEELVRIIRNEPLWDISKTYIDEASIKGGSALWCKMANGKDYGDTSDPYGSSPVVPGLCQLRTSDGSLNNAIKAHRGEATEDLKIYHPPNPFKTLGTSNRAMMNTRFTIAEAITVVMPWLDAKVKELLSNANKNS